MSIISKRLQHMQPSATLAIAKEALDLKQQGINIISLGAGEPDFDTPDNIKLAAIRAINEGFTKYTPVEGILELRTAICQKLLKENNLIYQAEQIIVSTGAKQAIYNAIMCSVDQQDEVIIPAPYWVSYPDIVELAGGKSVIISSPIDNDFKINATQLSKVITNNTKWLIINSPNNPTGSIYSQQELRELADILLAYPHVYIMSDDIYEHIIFDKLKFSNIVQVEPRLQSRALIINGLSKSYSMTGWRIGYAAGPHELIKAMITIQSQSTSNCCSISQKAAIEALSGPQDFIEFNKLLFEARRNLILHLLIELPLLNCNLAGGAFYLFIDCQLVFGKLTPQHQYLNNSQQIASYLLKEAQVAVVPGSAFGLEGYFRISYAVAEEVLINAFGRIRIALEKLI